MKKLIDYRFNIYSQNGEDGIIEEIFFRLNIDSGWLVEFGACDGKQNSNTFNLLKNEKFKSIYIEGNESSYKELLKTSELMNGRIIPIYAFVKPDGDISLSSILKKYDIPLEFNLLSIDVDGMDYQIWSKFKEYNPKLVIIEINSSILPDIESIYSDYNEKDTSFLSMLELGNNKGYTLICHTGNMIFLRNDLITEIRLDEDHINHPEKLFIYDWIKK